jgi:hypothetical protein
MTALYGLWTRATPSLFIPIASGQPLVIPAAWTVTMDGMSTREHKPTAEELIVELERLQHAGDEIRARIKDTLDELQTNAEEIKAVTKQQADNKAGAERKTDFESGPLPPKNVGMCGILARHGTWTATSDA